MRIVNTHIEIVKLLCGTILSGGIMYIRASDYKSNEILKFIRQSTDKTQKEFGFDIGKSKDWVQSNELGRSDFKFKDLMRLAEKNNVDIIIVSKDNKTKLKQ